MAKKVGKVSKVSKRVGDEEGFAPAYRTEILENVWDAHWYGPTKTLDVHVAALRRKLGDPAWIETVRGVGYRFGSPR